MTPTPRVIVLDAVPAVADGRWPSPYDPSHQRLDEWLDAAPVWPRLLDALHAADPADPRGSTLAHGWSMATIDRGRYPYFVISAAVEAQLRLLGVALGPGCLRRLELQRRATVRNRIQPTVLTWLVAVKANGTRAAYVYCPEWSQTAEQARQREADMMETDAG